MLGDWKRSREVQMIRSSYGFPPRCFVKSSSDTL
jgi:hypothetical protein